VTLDAYGWTGPWSERRGFDTLVQTSAGFSTAQMLDEGLGAPRLLPSQVLDIATGYLMAAAAIRGVTHRLRTGRGSTWRLALARTARQLVPQGPVAAEDVPEAVVTGPVEPRAYWSPSGVVRRLEVPVTIGDVPIFWEYPGDPYGSATPMWVGEHRRGATR
jgi:crotonobetainyl-CoA:carnitine CoA-transferase CaiB-like acyl-CoA transferase